MTRTEKVLSEQARYYRVPHDGRETDLIQAHLADISLTLAMLYDLMKEKESKDD